MKPGSSLIAAGALTAAAVAAVLGIGARTGAFGLGSHTADMPAFAAPVTTNANQDGTLTRRTDANKHERSEHENEEDDD